MRLSSSFGSPTAKIFFIKDSPSFDEIRAQAFLSDAAGFEFKKMLSEANIVVSDCYFSSVSRDLLVGASDEHYTTKKKAIGTKTQKIGELFVTDAIAKDAKNLLAEISAVKPNILVPLGELSLSLLRNETSISKWRGSVNMTNLGIKAIPTFSGAQIVKVWSWRYQAVRDLTRVEFESHFSELREPKYNFTIAPSFIKTMVILQNLINDAERLY